MSEHFNLIEILKDCPEGTKFYSTIFGDIEFMCIADIGSYSIVLKARDDYKVCVDSEGKYLGIYNGECILFPSREQRDWSKFKAPWHKKERFDPTTLKPFDKVLIKSDDDTTWVATLFSHIIKFHDAIIPGINYLESVTSYCTSSFCIPYNDETKHLVGTKDEAPEFYRYWED